MTQKKGGGERLVEFRLFLPPALVNRYRQLALDRTRETGMYTTWSQVVRDVLAAERGTTK